MSLRSLVICVALLGALGKECLAETFRVKTTNIPQAEIAGVALRAGVFAKGTIFFAHGFGCNKETMLRCYDRVPQREGWNAVFFDFRFHGQSQGSSRLFATLFSTLGYDEIWDMKAVVDWAEAQGLARPYVCVGASMGAAIALRFAGFDRRISAVFAESPYRTALDGATQWKLRGLPLGVLANVDFGRHRWMLEEVDIRRAVAMRDDLRIYLLAGERDFFPIAQQREIISASRSPESLKHFVVVKGAGHANFLGKPEHSEWFARFLRENANSRGSRIAVAGCTAGAAMMAFVIWRQRGRRLRSFGQNALVPRI